MTVIRKLNTNGPKHFEYNELAEKEQFKAEFQELCKKYDIAFETLWLLPWSEVVLG